MKRLWWTVGAVIVIGAIIVAAILLAPKSPIPPPVQSQLTSTLLVPKNPDAAIDRSSAKYDAANKLLTYNATYAKAHIVVSEQPTPDQFVDIPAAYTKVVDGMSNYKSFDVAVGTVHLTMPQQLNGKQAAVLNTKGTLIFAKPDINLTDDQWREFFNSFVVQN